MLRSVTHLRDSNQGTEIRLSAQTESTGATFGNVERYHMIPRLHTCHAWTNTLDDRSPFVAEDTRKHTFTVLSR